MGLPKYGDQSFRGRTEGTDLGVGDYRIMAQALFPATQGKTSCLGSSSLLHLQATGVNLTRYWELQDTALRPRADAPARATESPSWPGPLRPYSAAPEHLVCAGQWGCKSEKSFRDGRACDHVVGTQAGPWALGCEAALPGEAPCSD